LKVANGQEFNSIIKTNVTNLLLGSPSIQFEKTLAENKSLQLNFYYGIGQGIGAERENSLSILYRYYFYKGKTIQGTYVDIGPSIYRYYSTKQPINSGFLLGTKIDLGYQRKFKERWYFDIGGGINFPYFSLRNKRIEGTDEYIYPNFNLCIGYQL
jgi:hypothetical protein